MPENDPEKGFRTFRDGGLDKVDSRTFVQTVDSVSKERSFSLTRMLLVGQFRDEMIISCKVDLSTRRESNSHLKVPIFQGLCGGSCAHSAASNQRFAPIATQKLRTEKPVITGNCFALTNPPDSVGVGACWPRLNCNSYGERT